MLKFFIKKLALLHNINQERIKEDSHEAIGLKELLNNRINEYVEEVLTPYFGNLIRFVKECELIIEKGNSDILKTYESKFYLIIFSRIKTKLYP